MKHIYTKWLLISLAGILESSLTLVALLNGYLLPWAIHEAIAQGTK